MKEVLWKILLERLRNQIERIITMGELGFGCF